MENKIETLEQLKERKVEESEENDTFLVKGKVLRELLEFEWKYLALCDL